MQNKILLITLILFMTSLVLKSQSQIYDYERQSLISREYRDGKEVDDFREIGKAQVGVGMVT